MAETFDELVVKFSADISGLQASMNGASQQLAQFQSRTNAQLSSIEGSFKTIASAASLFSVALGAAGLIEFGKDAIEASMKVQALQFQLIAATGNTHDAGLAFDYAHQLADKLGLSMLDVGKGFAAFAVNAIGSGMSLKEAETIYEGFNVATKAIGVSNAGVARTMYALSEIMTQPTAQLRQLRMLAIDGRISFEEMGKSVGVTGEQFLQMVHDGKVVTDDFLPKLAAQLRHDFGDVASAASQTLQGNLNRLANQWLTLQTTFGQGGGLQAANVAVYALSNILTDLIPVAQAVGETLLGLDIIIAKLWEEFQLASSEADGLIDAFVALYTALGGFESSFIQFTEGNITGAFDTLKTASQGLSAELDKAAAEESTRTQQIVDDYNKAIKAIMTPYQMPQISRDVGGKQTDEGGKEKKPSKVTQNQVDSVEKYASGDDEATRLKIQLQEHQAIIDKAYAQGLISKKRHDDDMLALEHDYDKRVADYVAKNFGTEMEQENQDYKDKLDALKKALNQNLITQQQYEKQAEKLDKQHKKNLITAQNNYNREMRSDLQEAFDGFLGVQTTYQEKTAEEQGQSFRESIDQAGQHNRAFFELSKAAAIATALIKARQSVVDAYQFGTSIGGPALGAVFAGVAAAAQAANIAAIASTSFGGGGSVAGSAGSATATDSSSDTAVATNGSTAIASKNVTINLSGRTLLSAKDLRAIIDGINDQIGDGYTLNVA